MSQYTLERFDSNNVPIEVDNATTLNQSGLTLVGQYYSKFGEVLMENMLHMTENFAGPNQPSYANSINAKTVNLEGQLWFSTSDADHQTSKILKIQNSNGRQNTNGWKRLELIFSSTEPSFHTLGEQWFNTNRYTISVSEGSVWKPLMVETAYNSLKLNGIDGGNYLRKDIDDTMTGNLFSSNIYPSITGKYTLGHKNARWQSVSMNLLDSQYSYSIIPADDNTYNLGSDDKRWGNIRANTIRSDHYGNLNPIANNSYSIGSVDKKWYQAIINNLFVDKVDKLLPMSTDSYIGNSTNRWNIGYYNLLNVNNVASNLTPDASGRNIGQTDKPWNKIFVNNISSVKTQNVAPSENLAYDLGTADMQYNRIFARSIQSGSGTTFFGNNIAFDIVRNDRSKGITWTGLTDTHEIYVEEVDNNEKTRLVISSNNDTEDSTVFKNQNMDILEVKNTEVKSYKRFNTESTYRISDSNDEGMEMGYNSNMGCIEFRFI